MNILRRIFRKKNELEKVFTPTTSANLSYVPRKVIEKQLIKNLRIPGKQIIVYGHSGGGKTTILKNILNQQKKKYISIGCIKGTTVDDIILQAFDNLNPYFKNDYNTRNLNKVEAEVSQDYHTIKSAIKASVEEERGESYQRVLPVQLTPNRLIDFLGIAKSILIIEDFHKVDTKEKERLSQLLKLFVDAANKYNEVRIIAVGAVDTAREVVDYDSELSNRVYELHVPLLEKSELEQLIDKSSFLMNIWLTPNLKKEIVNYSNHLGAICHQLCFNMCYEKDIFITARKLVILTDKDLELGVNSFIKEKSDSYKALLDKALKQKNTKFKNVQSIFSAMVRLDKAEYEHGELLTQIHEYEKDYPQGNLSTYLKKLTSSDYDEIIRYDVNSNKYSFNDPFFKAYVVMVFKKEYLIENDYKTTDEIIIKFQKVLNSTTQNYIEYTLGTIKNKK